MSSLFFLMNLLLLQLLLLLRQRRRELLLRKQAPPSCSCSSHCATPASPWRPLQRHLAVLPSLAPAPAAVLCPGKAPPLGAEKKRLCAAQPLLLLAAAARPLNPLVLLYGAYWAVAPLPPLCSAAGQLGAPSSLSDFAPFLLLLFLMRLLTRVNPRRLRCGWCGEETTPSAPKTPIHDAPVALRRPVMPHLLLRLQRLQEASDF